MTDIAALAGIVEGPDLDGIRNRIAARRAELRMTLEEVAQASGFAKAHVWELEKGRSRNPTIRAIWSIAHALAVSPAWLLGLDTDQANLDPLACQVAALIDREISLRARSLADMGDES